MEKYTDIAIVGGGLASLAAALALEASGKEVVLVRKAPGMAALNGGGLELGDTPLNFPGPAWRQLPSIEENLTQLLQADPHHPLQVWKGEWGLERLFAYLQGQVRALTAKLPLTLSGDGNYAMALLGEMGMAQSVALCQSTQAGGDLRAMEGADLLVLGIAGLPGFRAGFLARTLWEMGRGFFKSVRAAEITLPFLKSNHSLSPFEIAESLDREEGRETFGTLVFQALEGKGQNHCLLPPVMGMIHHQGVLDHLQKKTGCTLAEVLAALPSVPGWRLSESILRYFQAEGYDLLAAEAVGFEASHGRVKALKLHRGSERWTLNTGKVILAPGKFLGGGIQDRVALREEVFGLPLFLQGRPLGEWSRRDLFTPRFQEAQPIFAAGVRVNGAGQALGLQGEVLYENLFACGRILSGVRVAGDRSASALSLISGAVAGASCRS